MSTRPPPSRPTPRKKATAGRVIVWADDATGFYGNISAKGGKHGGNGGFVETSGKRYLDFQGIVDTSAAQGTAGTLLLDPTDITISAAANTGNMTWTGAQFEDTATTPSNLNTTTLQNQLALSNVTVTTASGLAGAGNLTVSAPVTWSSGNSLTLFADNNLTVNADLLYSGAANTALTLRANNSILFTGGADVTASGTGRLDVTINSDRDASGAGAISMAAGTVITSNGGNITLGGGANPAAINAFGTAGNEAGITLDNAQLLSGAGTISLLGTGYGNVASTSNHGILIYNGADVISTSGTITFNGTAGTTDQSSIYGIRLESAGTSIVSTSGSIGMTGTGAGSVLGAAHRGFGVLSGAVIQSLGTAPITITGVGGNGAGNDHGILLSGAGSKITSLNGNISLTGTGNGASAYGIQLFTDTAIESTGTAAITLSGQGTGANPGIIATGGSNPIGGTSATGNITFLTNNINLSAAPVQTTGDVIIRPLTAGTPVGIGGGAGTLSVDDTELNNITYGGTLWLGGDSAWNQAGNLTITSPTANFNGNVNFLSGADVRATAGTLTKNGGTSGTTMNFLANNSILFSGSADITSSSGPLNIILNADRDASSAGAISLGAGTVLTSNNGNITLGGGANPSTTNAIGTAADQYGVLINSSILSGAGNIIINGTGYSGGAAGWYCGIRENGAGVIQSTSGNITLNGRGGASGGGFSMGVLINGGTISSTTGTINITGVGDPTAGHQVNAGVYLWGGSINSLGTGASASRIFIDGTGGNGPESAGYITIGGAINSIDGDINISAKATYGLDSRSSGFNVRTNAAAPFGILTTGNANITLDAWNTANTQYGTIFNSPATNFVLGGPTARGKITFITDGFNAWGYGCCNGELNFQTMGDVIIKPHTINRTVGIGMAIGGLDITDAFLNRITYGNTLYLGGDNTTSNAGNMTINSGFTFAKPVYFRSGADIRLTGTLTSSAAVGSPVLDAWGNFINTAGAAAINPGTGRYVVYSTDPALNTLNGLVADSNVFGRSFADYHPTSVIESGNVFIYRTGTYTGAGGGGGITGGGSIPTPTPVTAVPTPPAVTPSPETPPLPTPVVTIPTPASPLPSVAEIVLPYADTSWIPGESRSGSSEMGSVLTSSALNPPYQLSPASRNPAQLIGVTEPLAALYDLFNTPGIVIVRNDGL